MNSSPRPFRLLIAFSLIAVTHVVRGSPDPAPRATAGLTARQFRETCGRHFGEVGRPAPNRAVTISSLAGAAEAKPNVLILYADDRGFDDLNIQNAD